MGVQPGIRQIGKYTVLDVIGTGGMGIVYRAHDPAIGRTVAIKMLRQADTSGGIFDRFFSREMKSTGNLHHRNIVTVYDSGEQDGNPYLVMEFLEGEPASKLIAERRPIPLVEKLDLVIQVCDGLQYAHDRNIIHRDVKPANIIVLGDGTAKIVDFGVARIAGGESSIVQTGQLVGSLSYMSPEQINSIPIDARSDVFSTGVMLFELLTYELPFRGSDAASTFVKILREEPTPLSHFSGDFPAGLQVVLSRALAKNLNDRYQTAEEFGFDLLSVQKDLKGATIAECMKRAEAAMHRGDLDRVRFHLQEVIRLDRQNERANRLLREVRRAIQQQQRTSQVVQMRSQAQVALAGAQYEEALACADQALRLDPADTESIRLCDEIRNAISRVKAVREALNRAESALFAGDFDEAKEAVEESLRLDPSDSEARAMSSVINKELSERSRRQRVQGFVDQARREIAERKFSDALNALHQAEELDPSDSNVHELLQWALRGQEQEKRRRFLQEITEQIEKALHAGDFSSACTISDMGLSRFPDEPTLLRLRSISEKQRDIAERRRFVNDQSLAAKGLSDEGKLQEAIQVLTEALQRYPGEPNLESQLANIRAEVERLSFEREQAERQQAQERAAAEARARLTQQILAWSADLRQGLDGRAESTLLSETSVKLRSALEGDSFDEHAREVAEAVLQEVETRLRARDQAFTELEQLRRTLDHPHDTTALTEAENRLRSITAAFPHEPALQQRSAELSRTLTRLREQRDRAMTSLSTLARELERTPTSELTGIFRRAREIATGFAGDAQIGALLQQIESSVTRRLERHGDLLRDLANLSADLASAHSLEDVGRIAERGKAIAALDAGDRELAERLRQLELEAGRMRGTLESLLRELQSLGRDVAAAATIQEAEALVPRVKALADKRANFQQLQETAKRILAGIQGRRMEHDLIVQELESVRASLPVLESDDELHGASARSRQCLQSHAADPAVRSIATDIEKEVTRILQDRAAFRARTAECDEALRAAEERMQVQDWQGALDLLLPIEPRNADRADLRLQITVSRKALEHEQAEKERIESERIARERSEAEGRARQAAIGQALQTSRRLLSEDRGEEALQALQDALRRFPGDSGVQSALESGRAEWERRCAERERVAQQQRERERNAREKAEAEARARRAAAELAIGEASQLLARGRNEESVQRLRTALERDAANADLQAALHATQTEIAHRRAEAERERERLERLARETAEAEARARKAAAEQSIKEARRLFAQGDEDRALETLSAAIARDPANQDLALAHEALEADRTRARTERERAEQARLEREQQARAREEQERRAREQAEAEARARKVAADQAIREAAAAHARGASEVAVQLLQAAAARDARSQEIRAALQSIQSEVAARQAEQARQERERQERERAAHEKAEAEARARQAAVDTAIRSAREMLSRKNGDGALKALEEALLRQPGNAELATALAATKAEIAQQRAEQERLRQEQQEQERIAREKAEAEERARKAAAEKAIERATKLVAQEQSDEALRVLRAAVEADPKNAALRAAIERTQAELTKRREEQKRQEKERAREEKAAKEKARADARKAEAAQAEARRAEAERRKLGAASVPAARSTEAAVSEPSRSSRTAMVSGGAAAGVFALGLIGFYVFHSSAPGTLPVTFTMSPADARLTVDGEPTDCPGTCVVKLKPGGHKVELAKDAYNGLVETLTVNSSDRNCAVSLALTPVPPSADQQAAAPSQPPQVPPSEPARDQVAGRAPAAVPVVPKSAGAQTPSPIPPAQIKKPSGGSPANTAPSPDAAAWASVKDSQSLSALRDFHTRYASSPYAAQAQDRMDELSWGGIRGSAQTSDFQQYLKDFPAGHHAAEARDQVSALQAKAQQAEQQAQQLAQQQAQKQATQHEHDLVLQTLEAYRTAYEGKNINELASVWVNAPRTSLERAFKYADKIHVTLLPSNVTISGDSATVPCRQRIEIIASTKTVNEATILFTLKKQQGRWVIESAK